MLSVVLAQQQRGWPHRERRNGQLSPMFAAWAVTEKLHRSPFKRCVRPLHNCRHFFSHNQLVEWECGDAQNSGARNPRHGALQRMARNRGHHGGRSSNLRSYIRKQHPDLRFCIGARHRPSSSASRFTTGALGFFILSQLAGRLAVRYGEPNKGAGCAAGGHIPQARVVTSKPSYSITLSISMMARSTKAPIRGPIQ